MSKGKPDPNRPRRWQAILRRIPIDEPWTGVEVGVWMGRTAKEILAARPRVTHHMVDSWMAPKPNSTYAKSPDKIAKNGQPYFDECYEKTQAEVRRFGERAEIHRMYSKDAAELFEDGSLDYAFVDCEHTYEGVFRDIKLWLPKVRPGGWIGFHDYGNLPRFPGVQMAVDEAFGNELELDGDCTAFHWVKP